LSGIVLGIVVSRFARAVPFRREKFFQSPKPFRLGQSAEDVPTLLYVFDLVNHRCLYTNRQSSELLGYHPSEIYAAGSAFFIERWHPEEHQQNQQHFQRLRNAADREAVQIEYRFRHADGSWRWLRSREVVLSRDATGRPTQALGIAIDVSDRKLAEAALITSERRIRQMTDALPAYFSYLDRQQRYQFVNQMYEKRFGCARSELIGKPIWEVLGEAAYRSIADRLEQALAGNSVSYSVEQTDDAGVIRYLDVALVPDADPDRGVQGCFSLVFDVTAQRQSEEALRQSDQRFQGAFNTTAVGMAVVAPDGTLLEVNSALCNIFGYRRAELVGRTFQAITHPDDLPGNLELFKRLVQGELAHYNLEKRYIHKQGHVVWGLVSVSMVRDRQGQPLYQVALVQDITERKRAEQALQEREALLRSISNNIPKGVLYQLVHDPEDNSLAFSYVSAGIKDLLGVSAEAVMQDINVLYDLLLEEDREKVDRLTQISLENLTVYEAQVRQRKLQNGIPQGIVWSSSRAVPRRLADGRTVWDGVAVDITELKETEAALRQSEAKMRAVLEAIPDLVLLTDRHGQGLAYHNGGEVLLLKRTVGQQDNQSVYDVLPEPVAQERMRCIHKALETRELQTHEYELCINGETRCEEARIVASSADEAVVFVRDITEAKRREAVRQQFEAELRQAKEAAEAANQAKSTFLSQISHELRSPLNTLLGYAQLLARGSNLTPTQHEYLEVLDRSGNHLAQIINDVLSLARIEAGQVTLKPGIVHLPDLLTSVRLIFQMRAKVKGLQIRLHAAANLPHWIEADEGKLRQVLINLLDNAIKFTPQGSITLSVTLQSPSTLQFAVTDTGVGIAPEDLSSIFEAFLQTESGERSHQGSGLGLAISAQLVQLMGGEICAESQLGQGATLHFTLPFKPAESDFVRESAVQGDRHPNTVVRLAPDQPQYRILVADDIEANARLAEQWLTLAGFEVEIARNGAEAIEQWQKFAPHLIWMDVRMPQIDGLAATARIRALEQEQPHSTKIIAVSATAFEEERQRALATGCSDFVSKPYSEDVLLNTLQRHLGAKYHYEQIGTEVGGRAAHLRSAAAPMLTAADFQGISPEWVAQLNWAARVAREESIQQLLDQIPAERQALRDAIAYLAKNFRFEQLIEITESIC
jgi:PAS domain S-box-containing protein